MTMIKDSRPVLVTGATGYVGGRLVPRLLSSGYRVRVIGRSASKITGLPWAQDPALEIAQADIMDYQSLIKAARGCWAAYYLVHSMNPQQKNFAEADRKAAKNMAKAANDVGLERIIYLGGLGDEKDTLSKHLQSRIEVAKILQQGRVPTTFLRAAMILGSGSASFEILRYLVERLPVMITPAWLRNPVQPIAIGNVLNYLQGCLEHEETLGQTFDIGGPEISTYQGLFDIYAEEAGLMKRLIIQVPVLTPWLSSHWINFVTPIPAYIAKPLAEGLRNPVVCKEHRIRAIIPQDLIGCREAIRLSLRRIRNKCEENCRLGKTSRPPECVHPNDPPYAGGTIFSSCFSMAIKAGREQVRKTVLLKGAQAGWYAKIKAPGEVQWDFSLLSSKDGHTEVEQSFLYVPKGLLGLIYWYALYPVHQFLCRAMLKGIAKAAAKPILWGPKRHVHEKIDLCRPRSMISIKLF